MHAFLRCLALVLLLPQCGGGATTGAEPKSAADDAHNSSDASEAAGSSSGDSADASASDAPATAEKSKGPNCDDGTCSKCGSGICPAGWYCDEKASGGGACSWLTECAEKPTCACITRVLGASCKCHENNGALKVACD